MTASWKQIIDISEILSGISSNIKAEWGEEEYYKPLDEEERGRRETWAEWRQRVLLNILTVLLSDFMHLFFVFSHKGSAHSTLSQPTLFPNRVGFDEFRWSPRGDAASTEVPRVAPTAAKQGRADVLIEGGNLGEKWEGLRLVEIFAQNELFLPARTNGKCRCLTWIPTRQVDLAVLIGEYPAMRSMWEGWRWRRTRKPAFPSLSSFQNNLPVDAVVSRLHDAVKEGRKCARPARSRLCSQHFQREKNNVADFRKQSGNRWNRAKSVLLWKVSPKCNLRNFGELRVLELNKDPKTTVTATQLRCTMLISAIESGSLSRYSINE